MILDMWAKVAEISSAIVVVASLVFLIAEVRQNTNSIRASTYQNIMADLNSWRLAIAADPSLSLAFQKAINGPDELTGTERARVKLILDAMWGNAENAYFARQHEVLGDSEWARFKRIICENRDRMGWSVTERLLTNEFNSFIRNCGAERVSR